MTHIEQHGTESMPPANLIQWEDWHAQVVARKEAILRAHGETDSSSYEDLRKAEIEAMRLVRAERKQVQ